MCIVFVNFITHINFRGSNKNYYSTHLRMIKKMSFLRHFIPKGNIGTVQTNVFAANNMTRKHVELPLNNLYNRFSEFLC